MPNFEKDLREYSDEELYKKINTEAIEYVYLYSDELTRRSNDRSSQRLVELTLLLSVLAIMQFFISLRSISTSWMQWSVFVLFTSWFIFVFVRSIKKPNKMKKIKTLHERTK